MRAERFPFVGMALFGSLDVLSQQLVQPDRFATALAYLAEARRPGSEAHRLLAGLPVGKTGRVELAGGAFALPQAYLTRDRNAGRWETHRAFIDVQAVLVGEEFMEIADREQLTVAEDLTPGRDVIFYQPFAGGSVLRLTPGLAAVYFPRDAHLGCIAIGAPAPVRKVVVKVPA
jgi:YhcH/YjgK/YiaL family protein